MMDGKHLFFSYSRTDAQAVQALAAECTELGLKVWLDQQLSGGQPWWDRILEEIRRCDCFVFGVSAASLQSKACRAELDYAHSLGRTILPVTVGENVPDQLLPSYLAETHRVDPRQKFQLGRALLALPLTPPLPDPLPVPPPVPISYLGELADLVERRQLTLAEQRNLAGELRGRLALDDERAAALALLHRFRQRPDVYAAVAGEIDDALSGVPPRLPPPSAPTIQAAVPSSSPPAPPKRNKAKYVAVACVAVLGIGGVGTVAALASSRDESSATLPTAPRTTEFLPDTGPTDPPAPPETDPPDPVVTEPAILSLKEMFPAVDFDRCEILTNSNRAAEMVAGFRCSPSYGIVAEFYNWEWDQFETDVRYWTDGASYAGTWSQGGGEDLGRYLEVLLENGTTGIYWTYDEYAFSALAFPDPSTGAGFSDVETWWRAFRLDAVAV